MKRLLSTLCGLGFSVLTAQAQITYHDISPDTTINYWEAFVVYPPALNNGQLVIWYHPTPEVVVQSMGNWEVLFDGALPAKLNAGDSIAQGSGTWKKANYDALNSNGKGLWQTTASDKFLAFRYQNSSGYNYGWLKMSVAPGASSFTVKEYAYQSQPDQKINAGQTGTITTGVSASSLGNDLGISLKRRQLQLLQADGANTYQIALIDMAGHVVKRATLQAREQLQLEDLAAGNYLVQIRLQGYTKAYKISIR